MRVAAAFALALMACGRVNFDPFGVAGDDDDTTVDAIFGDAPMAVSCMGLQPTCGPTGTNDCCETLPVPGGMFYRGYDVAPDIHNDQSWPATVSSFWLDKYEVTVGRYRRYLNAAAAPANRPAENAGARTLNGTPDQGGWQTAWDTMLPGDPAAQIAALNCDAADQTWTDTPGANENLPLSCLSWFDAMAFCIWDGGFLPTEAEWNYAASGGSDHRAFPWSNPPASLTLDCEHANFYIGGGNYCTGAGAANRVGTESPAGDGRWGHADLAGNLWEWTLDGYRIDYPTPCADCAELTTVGSRATRGGYFKNGTSNMRAANKSSSQPETRVQHIGVRCARRA